MSEQGRQARPPDRSAERDEPVLPDRPERERDEAWGDTSARRDEDWYRRERPPHHE